jgi:hypothetical protein
MRAQLRLYTQLDFGNDLFLMRYKPKTISLREDVLAKGMVRSKQFRLKFSAYLSQLIERDYASGSRRIVIVADQPPEQEQK